MKTYIEEFLTTFSGFHQTVFSFLTAYSLQQLFPQLTAHNNFFHSHSPTKQTFRLTSPYTHMIHELPSNLFYISHALLCDNTNTHLHHDFTKAGWGQSYTKMRQADSTPCCNKSPLDTRIENAHHNSRPSGHETTAL
jgi:hypothetical protein